MNKTELKNFAISARRDLLEKVALRAKLFGIDEKNGLTIEEKFGQLAINGETYSLEKKSALLSLQKQLEIKGYEQLIEEVAYIWFNRIIAIRYMEVNDYLPERVNVLSSSTGKIEPDIISEFETMNLGIDTAVVKDLIRQGEAEAAYRKLFIAQCNALNKLLPFMFEKINDYSELLLPEFLLDSESIINKLVLNQELTDSFTEVEVIGWLYQFYNSEPKDTVFANLKKNKKIEKYDIPAATQLFTPKWIVQYMVENSLGQLWLESNPNSPLKETMRYYIEPAEQDEEVKRKLEKILYKNVNLEEITIIDPCVGSGHILVYTFDLLYQMYEEAGYPTGDIPQLILEKNLFGLDIDNRAVQLASFTLMMKARGKSRRIFREQVKLNIHAIHETNDFDKVGIVYLLGEDDQEKDEISSIIDTFIDAKNYGSIIVPAKIDFDKYLDRIQNLGEHQLSVESFEAYSQIDYFYNILLIAKILASNYHITITNPPYLGLRGMNAALTKYLNTYYPNSKYDLYAVFIERLILFSSINGFNAIVNQQSWMFLSRYEKLRSNILQNQIVYNMVHLGSRAFDEIAGEKVQTTTYVLRNHPSNNYKGTYIRLVNYNSPTEKENEFLMDKNKFMFRQSEFDKIPSRPIAYWSSEKIREIFIKNKRVEDLAEPKVGQNTGDNDRFLKKWFEVNFYKIGFNIKSREESIESKKKWFPYNKGGSFRKWYGNQEYVVNWENDGEELKEFAVIRNKGKHWSRYIQNLNYIFKEGITWSDVSTTYFGPRYTPPGFIFDVKGSTMFFKNKEDIFPVFGVIASKISSEILQYINPTMSFQTGDIRRIPLPNKWDSKINDSVKENIALSKEEWNDYELSWEFIKHPFLTHKKSDYLSESFNNWEVYSKLRFHKLKKNEENINQILISLFQLEDEFSPELSEDQITLRISERVSDVKSFLSYFVGCIMGRYSLDEEGLYYAGGEWDGVKQRKFNPNNYGILMLTEEHYFENDIIARLREFLTVTFGAKTVDDNLQWLAEALEIKGNEAVDKRLRRYFLDEFFNDHCQLYQKRPVYWLIDSGKQKGLRTLIYMHRYQPDTMATIRFEHLQEIQAKYNNEISAIDLRIVNPNLSATEKRDLEKRKISFQKRLEELLEFDKKLAEYANAQIAIDLDDGVKVNYEKFDNLLAKIK